MSIEPPFMVSYSITTKCNLKCKHCYSESVDQAAPDELSTEEAFRLSLSIAGNNPVVILNLVSHATALTS